MMRWTASGSDDKRETIENASRAMKISTDAKLRLPQQLRWN